MEIDERVIQMSVVSFTHGSTKIFILTNKGRMFEKEAGKWSLILPPHKEIT